MRTSMGRKLRLAPESPKVGSSHSIRDILDRAKPTEAVGREIPTNAALSSRQIIERAEMEDRVLERAVGDTTSAGVVVCRDEPSRRVLHRDAGLRVREVAGNVRPVAAETGDGIE